MRKFALQAYNQKPASPLFRDKDPQFPAGKPHIVEVPPLVADKTFPFDLGEMGPLEALYLSYKVPQDGSVQKVVLRLEAATKIPEIGVDGIVTVKEPKVEHWTGKSKVTYCLDKEDEKVREFILILSSGKIDGTPTGEIKVEPSSKPCGEWAGTISYEYTYIYSASASKEDTLPTGDETAVPGVKSEGRIDIRRSTRETVNKRSGWSATVEFEAKKLPWVPSIPTWIPLPPGITLPTPEAIPHELEAVGGSVVVFRQDSEVAVESEFVKATTIKSVGEINAQYACGKGDKSACETLERARAQGLLGPKELVVVDCTQTHRKTADSRESITLPDKRVQITLEIEGDQWRLAARSLCG